MAALRFDSRFSLWAATALILLASPGCSMTRARPLWVQPHTLGWLERNDLRWDLLVMRDVGDYDDASHFKARTVEELRAVDITPTLAFEDDRRNVAMFRSRGVPCVYIHSGHYD